MASFMVMVLKVWVPQW